MEGQLMHTAKILGCCEICDRYEQYMKSTRRGARTHRKMMRKLSRQLRRMSKQRMHREDYEPVFLAGYRWY
jgi:hypothetical protein